MHETRQGVRDLNGPRMNGTGYNGHKSATCAHHRAPDLTPTHVMQRATVDELGHPVTKNMVCCSVCGAELFEAK